MEKIAIRQTESMKRRQRNHSKSPHWTYKPYLDDIEIFNFLVMTELEVEEKKEEAQGYQLTQADWIKRRIKHLIQFTMTHTSYHAAVAIGRVLGDYPPNQAWCMYALAAPNRASAKDNARCTKTTGQLRKSVASRFGIKEEDLLQEKNILPSSNWQVALIIKMLELFVPSDYRLKIQDGCEPDDKPSSPSDDDDIQSDAENEVDCISMFINPKNFDELARATNSKRLEESLRDLNDPWPPPTNLQNPWPPPKGPHPVIQNESRECARYNLEEIRDYVEKQRERRSRAVPGWLSIRVDGIDRHMLSGSEDKCEIAFEADATMVDIVGLDYEGDVVLATYILTYDDQPRTEEWEPDLPGSQKLQCTFEYDEENRVHAKFTLTNPEQLHAAALQNREYAANQMTSAMSRVRPKTRILNFAGVLISIAVLLAIFIRLNNQQRLDNQRAAHELNLLQRFSQDIGNAKPGQRSKAMAAFRAMSPRFAAPVAPIAAEVDPMTSISRVVEILTDRSLDSETRGVAERSRQQIMSDFRIKEPSYDSKVDERQVLRGTTPFPGLRYYIIVTTPQGQDFVSSEAKVSGDSWEGVATFGSAGAGAGEKFYVRVIATKASLSEGPFSGTVDAISSDSIPVVRRP